MCSWQTELLKAGDSTGRLMNELVDKCRYGQTGSGKTYTLLGAPDAPGIVPKAFQKLGQALQNDRSMTVSVSVVWPLPRPRVLSKLTAIPILRYSHRDELGRRWKSTVRG